MEFMLRTLNKTNLMLLTSADRIYANSSAFWFIQSIKSIQAHEQKCKRDCRPVKGLSTRFNSNNVPIESLDFVTSVWARYHVQFNRVVWERKRVSKRSRKKLNVVSRVILFEIADAGEVFFIQVAENWIKFHTMNEYSKVGSIKLPLSLSHEPTTKLNGMNKNSVRYAAV